MKNLFYYFKSLFFSLFLICAFTLQVGATDFIFSGTGNYTDASLWSPSYPTGQIGVGDTAIISTGSNCTIPSGNFIHIQGALVNGGELISYNTLGSVSGGSIINNGYIHVFAAIDNTGNIFNNGTIEVEGNFSNQGDGIIDNAAGATIINKGSFIASSISGGSFNFEGTFKGGGTIFVQDYPNLGIIAPGFSPGVLTFKNNLNLDNSGSLEIEIAGMGGAGTINGHDQIIVDNFGEAGDLSINGTLKVRLLDGFTPEVGNQWIIATGNTAGTFSTLDLPIGILWDVDIQTDKIILDVIGVTLPVALANFSAIQKKYFVQLDWSTNSESQNEGWEIDRLDEQHRWQNLGEVSGNGYSNTISNYQFKDLDPGVGLNYYRIAQIDFDGQKVYSPNVSVDFRKEQVQVLAYPNPIKRMLYFSELINSAIIYNLQGQRVFILAMAVPKLDLGNLDSGVYILKFKTGTGGQSKTIYIE